MAPPERLPHDASNGALSEHLRSSEGGRRSKRFRQEGRGRETDQIASDAIADVQAGTALIRLSPNLNALLLLSPILLVLLQKLQVILLKELMFSPHVGPKTWPKWFDFAPPLLKPA